MTFARAMTFSRVWGRIKKIFPLPHPCLLLLLVLLSIGMRLPFFFTSTDGYMRDEATTFHDEAMFIQQGREVLGGHLPYLRHWDNAPPLSWIAWAPVVLATGGNLVAFRLFGALYIALTGFVLYRTLAARQSRGAGLWAAAFYIIFASTLNASQSFSSDHLVGLPFAGMLYYLFNAGDSRRRRAYAAALFTVCFLMMVNFLLLLPVVALVMPGFEGLARRQAAQGWRGRVMAALRPFFPYAARCAFLGGCCFLGFSLFYLIYWVAGQQALFVKSLFDTLPLFAFDRSAAAIFPWSYEPFVNFHLRYLSKIFHSRHWLVPVIVTCYMVMLAGSVFMRHARRDALSLQLLLLGAAAFILPFYRGAFTNHYLFYTLQCLPVFSLIMGRMMSLDLSDARWFAIALTCMGLSDSTRNVVAAYPPLMSYFGGNKAYSVSYFNDRLYKVAHILNIIPMKGRNMVVCGEDDILYALTGAENPRYFYFPFYPYSKALLDTLDVQIPSLRTTVVNSAPVYIVGREGDGLTSRGFAEIGDILQLKYIQVSNIEGTVIFVRKDAMQEIN